ERARAGAPEGVGVAARVVARRGRRPQAEDDAGAPLAEEDAEKRESIERGVDASGHFARIAPRDDRVRERRRGDAEHEAGPERQPGTRRPAGEERESGEAAN